MMALIVQSGDDVMPTHEVAGEGEVLSLSGHVWVLEGTSATTFPNSVMSPMWMPRTSDFIGCDHVGVPSGPSCATYIGPVRFW